MDVTRLQPMQWGMLDRLPPPPSFPQYLRAPINNKTSFEQQYVYQHHPRQPRSLPSHHHAHPPRAARSLLFHHSTTTMNPNLNNHRQPFAPGYSEEEARRFFSGGVDDSMLNHYSAVGMIPNYYAQPAYNNYSFRPLIQLETAGPSPQSAPFEAETEQPVMAFRNTSVDTKQYSPVSQEEVWNTPLSASSPEPEDATKGWPSIPSFDVHTSFADLYKSKGGADPPSVYSADSHGAHSGSVSTQSSSGSFSSFDSNESACHPDSIFCARDSFSSAHTTASQLHDFATNREATVHDPSLVGVGLGVQGLDTDEELAVSETEDNEDVASAASASPNTDSEVRDDRDRLLLDLRSQGYSYKEIKRIGNFGEAESTLRGRMRVLTKEKHERVRKPQWHSSDIALLRHAVRHFSRPGLRTRSKLPWGRVSAKIHKEGASYPFAAATCAKKWAEINRK